MFNWINRLFECSSSGSFRLEQLEQRRLLSATFTGFDIVDAAGDDSTRAVFDQGAVVVDYSTSGATIDRVDLFADSGGTAIELASFQANAITDGLINLAPLGLGGGSHDIYAVAYGEDGSQATSATISLDVLSTGGLTMGDWQAETFTYTGAPAMAVAGRGGTDALSFSFSSTQVQSLNGDLLANYDPDTPVSRQAIYLGTAFDYIELSDGSEIYISGVEFLDFTDMSIELTPHPDDARYEDQWNLFLTDVPDAWRFTTGSTDTLVASLDTGIPENGDGSINYGNLDPNRIIIGEANDDTHNGHGLNAMQVMAATPDNAGTVGINWGSDVYVGDVYGGIDWDGHVNDAAALARSNGQNVVYQGGVQGAYWADYSNEQAVIDAADVGIFAIAAGNDGVDIIQQGGIANMARTHEHVLAITGMNGGSRVDVRGLSNPTSISQQFNNGPGVSLATPSNIPTGNSGNFTGTSSANPGAAGVASLVWDANPNLTGAEVSRLLTETALDVGEVGRDVVWGWGVIDAGAAVRRSWAIGENAALANLNPHLGITPWEPTGGLEHAYEFDGNADDSIGSSNGTLKNGATVSGGVLNLDGTDDFVQINGGSFEDVFHEYTIAARFKADGVSDTQVIYVEGNDDVGIAMYVNLGFLHTRIGNHALEETVWTAIEADTWYHVAATFDQGELALYIDGELMDSKDTHLPMLNNHNGGAAIGAARGAYVYGALTGQHHFFDGQIDDVQVYNDQALTAAQVAALASGAPINQSPTATNDTATTDEDTTVLIDVLANDTDPDGDTLTIDSVGTASNGTVTMSGGQIQYDPNAGFTGSDAFTYTINDGNGGTDSATVNVTVDSVATGDPLVTNAFEFDSDADDAIGGLNGTLANGATLVAGGVTGNAVALDGVDDFVNIDNGELENAFTDYSVTVWFKADNLSGNQHLYEEGGWTHGIGLRLNGSTLEAGARRSGNQQIAGVDGVTAGQWHMAVLTFTDGELSVYLDGAGTTATNATGWSDIPSHSSPAAVGRASSDSVFFKGSGEYFDGLIDQVRIYDGQALSAAQVQAAYDTESGDIGEPNQSPVATNDSATTTQDTAVLIDVLANDSDPDGDPLTIDSVGTASNGTVTINAGQVEYNPNPGFTGSDAFTYTINDGNGGTDSATVNLTIDPVSTDVPDPTNHWALTSNANDSVGGLTGTLQNGAAITTEGVHLDGTDDFVNLNNNALEDGFSSYSVALAFNADNVSSTQFLYEEGGNTKGLAIRLTGSTLEVGLRTGGTTHTVSVSGITAGEWHTVVTTFDAGELSVYVDGTALSDTLSTGVSSLGSHSNPAAIGRQSSQSAFGSGNGGYFAGHIADLKIWDGTALTKADVAALNGTDSGDSGTEFSLQNQDVGNVAATGSTSESSGTYTVSGSGGDIWGSKDRMQFAYTTLDGDGEITARVTSQTNTHAWAKAGLMIRESLDQGAKNVAALMTPGNGLRTQWRSDTDSPTGGTSSGSFAYGDYLRLTRVGDVFTTYHSSDGNNWTQMDQVTVSMSQQVYVGLAVTSHSDGTLSDATFEDVQIID